MKDLVLSDALEMKRFNVASRPPSFIIFFFVIESGTSTMALSLSVFACIPL